LSHNGVEDGEIEPIGSRGCSQLRRASRRQQELQMTADDEKTPVERWPLRVKQAPPTPPESDDVCCTQCGRLWVSKNLVDDRQCPDCGGALGPIPT
jgi:hypothetical protein